ncbi:MAG: hypothetical protein LQ344_005804 [Seirophora lacunosa]|nr:MAG: hypothetical protein LQ344_005804 [Seirophora lacunosa]
MSGIEVAGIALAVFPIVVKGLGQMMQGMETIMRWKKYKRELEKYAFRLDTASLSFRDTLTRLLNDIVPSDVDFDLMIAEPMGPLWKEPIYEERLRDRLDQSYKSYLKTIESLAKGVEELRNKLRIDGSGAVQWDSYSIVEREMERIKITLKKRVYKELLDEIDQANKDLRKFTQQSISLEPIKRERRSKRPIAELKLIRKHAASLYRVLMNDKAWKCSCKTHHRVSLCLEARPKIPEVKPSTPKDLMFRAIITVSNGADTSGATTRWEEVEVIPSFGNQKLGAVLEKTDHHPARKEVRFASLIDETALCTPVLDRRPIGLLVDDAFDKHQHKLYRADSRVKSQSMSKSLEDLLRASRQPDDNDGLSRKERLEIAVVLASSILQLGGTSWLRSDWSSGDIFFHHEASQAFGAAESTRFPYLSIRNHTLLALGLVLVELCFGRTLTGIYKREDFASEATVTKLNTATRLLDLVYTEMGLNYGDAVRRCLFSESFDVRELSLDIEEVQQKMLDGVVVPLVEDLKSFMKD